MERPALWRIQKRKSGEVVYELSHLLGVEMPNPIYQGCHRWRYAKVKKPAATAKLASECRRIAIAGDWVSGPRIEAAFLSGLEAFKQLNEAAELEERSENS